MNKKTIYKMALSLAVPMMIQSGITNAVGLIDNLMVGSLGTESITAVSIAGQLLFVFSLAVFGGLSGPGIYLAQYFGQNNQEGMKNVFRIKCFFVSILVLAGIAIFWFFGNNLILLYFQGEAGAMDPELTLRLANDYLRIMLIGLVPFGITQIYAGSLRETGESIKPMVAGIGSVVTDILFNYLLIYGKFGFPRLEVRGAAIASVIARFAEVLIILIWTYAAKKKHTFLIGAFSKLTVPATLMKTILIKSMPIFVNEFMWAGGMAFMTQCFSVRGLEVIAGSNICNAICNLLNIVFISLGNAIGIIIGQMLGASKLVEAKNSSLKLMRFTAVLCAGLTVILIALAPFFPRLYETTDFVRTIGRNMIIINALFFPVQGYLNSLYFTLRSGGKTVITFLFDSVFTWVVSIPIAFFLNNYTGLSIYLIFALIQLADIIKLAIGYVLIRKGVWITNLVETLE